MKRKIRLTESELHGIIRKSVSRILREEDEENKEWKSPLDKTKESKFKVKGKMDVSGYRKKNLHGKIRKDTIGNNIDDETMKKLKNLHSENYIRRAVRESVNRVLNEENGTWWTVRVVAVQEWNEESSTSIMHLVKAGSEDEAKWIATSREVNKNHNRVDFMPIYCAPSTPQDFEDYKNGNRYELYEY